MSGGGGSPPYSGGGGGGGGSDCKIVEQVILNSPNPKVLPTLRVGDELDVTLVPGPALAAVPKSGGPPAGALTPSRLADLINCITTGHAYKAIVLRIVGGLCEVEIRPR